MPIAIVGAACRLPGAPDLALFADLLFAGRDAVTQVPADRWPHARFLHPDAKQPGKAYTMAAGVLDRVDTFDAAFFGISPREAQYMDPQQRLLLELAYETMEDAGQIPARLAGTEIGVYIGGSNWDYTTIAAGDIAGSDVYSMQGAALSSMANRISYVFALGGPSLTVDTACSSSLVALHLACEAIRRDEVPAALVGGVNMLLVPHSFVGFSRASMLSRRGRCQAFDSRADGYVRAEGGAVVMLKPLAQALADGDQVHAVIRGTGVNSDGRTPGFSVPSRKAQADLLRAVMARAEVEPDDLSYMEAHGTGTPVGDPIEANAIGEAVGRHRTRPLPMGSVKTNLGHLEPASGMAGLLKLAAAFQRREIPKSLHLVEPNPNIDFAALNLSLVPETQAMQPGPQGLVAGVNSFGFGGTNAHAILTAAPEPAAAAPEGEGPLPPLLLSARSEAALKATVTAWAGALAQAPDKRPLLRAAARRRAQHPHRLAVSATTAPQLEAALKSWLGGKVEPRTVTGEAADGKLAFVFSGNGSQWAGMGSQAMRGSAAFRAMVERADAAMTPLLGWSVAARLAGSVPPPELRKTAVAQPLLFAVQLGIVAALREAGIVADLHTGHSAGEVAAAWAAGALSLEDAAAVIVHRSLGQQHTHGQGGMAVLGLGPEAAEAAIAEVAPGLSIGAINTPSSITVAGPAEPLDALGAEARARGWTFVRLDLDYAFHSEAMAPVQAPLLCALDGIAPRAGEAAFVSTVTGGVLDGASLTPAYWWRNVREPVRFADAVATLVAEGATTVLEIGPHPVLQSYLRDGMRGAEPAPRVLSTLSQRQGSGDPFPAIAAQAHVVGADMSGAPLFDGPAARSGLPSYPWQRERFWVQISPEGLEIVKPAGDHRLLGYRRSGGARSWEQHLSPVLEPWLKDHVVDGQIVLPAAAMIETALAAAAALHPEAAALEITGLEISRPLILEADGTRALGFEITDGHGAFALSSRARPGGETQSLHATGRLGVAASAAPLTRRLDLDAARPVPPAELYRLAAAAKLHYGPAFRTVAAVEIASTTTACVALAAGEDGPGDGFRLDPTRLDGAFQGLIALVAASGQARSGSLLPWRFERVRLLRRDGAEIAAAELHITRIGPRSIRADIALLDGEGAVVAELLDCWFAEVRTGSGAEAADHSYRRVLVPSLAQPAHHALDEKAAAAALAALRPHEGEPGEAALLAESYAARAAYDALAAIAGVGTPIDPALLAASGAIVRESVGLAKTLLGWLVEDGLAEAGPTGITLLPDDEVPPAAAIWQSVLFDAPTGVAETALAGAAGQALEQTLRSGAKPGGSHALSRQMLTASPSAEAAVRALLDAVQAGAAALPHYRALRVAEVGTVQTGLTRGVLERLAGRPVRYVRFAAEEDAADAEAALTGTPGAELRPLGDLAELAGCFDLVLGLDPPEPERLPALLAPSGLLLTVVPEPSRIWTLAQGAEASGRLRASAHWSQRMAGATAVRLGAGLFPMAVLSTRATAAEPASPVRQNAVLFTLDPFWTAHLTGAVSNCVEHAPETLGRALLTAAEQGAETLVVMLPELDDDCVETASGVAGAIAPVAAALAEAGVGLRFLVLAPENGNDTLAAAITGLARVLGNEVPGLVCRVTQAHHQSSPGRIEACLAFDMAQPDGEPESVWDGVSRLLPRMLPRVPVRAEASPVRKLVTARPGLLGSLGWAPMPAPRPGPAEVAIRVEAAGLNFRDVMWALGLLPDEALLDGFSGPGLGLECAGVVTAVGAGVTDLAPGDRVVAVSPSALATHAVTARHAVMRLPDGMDFAAAATVPVAFLTTVYALGHLARLQPGERVLIHGAAGAVGLAAVQYARAKGAEVFATAGSDVKRALVSLLGVSHVFDSRSAAFADAVLAATGGEGVDVVLNSLAGELMEKSLTVLRPFGRFLEIGKRDLYADTPIGIRPFRHNVSYFAIDADELAAKRPALAAELFAEIQAMLLDGRLSALPHRVYPFAEAEDAFRLLQASGHIGKVVLVPGTASLPAPSVEPAFAADPAGTYLITGGLAGFGLETARWLARRGAKALALLGRRGVATPGAELAIAELARQGVKARAYACDVADEAALAATLAQVRGSQPPIVGVVHAAMVMDDARLEELDAARFAAVLGPKLKGALALDKLTADDKLSLFLLYSSVAVALGNPGQANYVMANAAIEALAAGRQSQGKPALAIQFGPIEDAGYLARETRVAETLAKLLGSSHARAVDALDAIPAALASGLAVVGHAALDWAQARRHLPLLATPPYAAMAAAKSAEASGSSLTDELRQMEPEAARARLVAVLLEEAGGVMKAQTARLDPLRPLSDLGMDSLMGLELRMAIEARLGVEMPMLSLSDGATLTSLAERLLASLGEGKADPDAGIEKPPADAKQAAREAMVSRLHRYNTGQEAEAEPGIPEPDPHAEPVPSSPSSAVGFGS